MKRVIGAFFVIILSCSISSAQFETGSVELALSGAVGSWSQNLSAPGMNDYSHSSAYFLLDAAMDYYIVNGLSLQPEIGIMTMEESEPSEVVLLNLSYTSRLPESKVALFARAGYGIGNALTVTPLGNYLLRQSDKWDVDILNAGAGAKILFNENVALRLELNYRRQSLSVDYSTVYLPVGSVDYTYSNIGVLIGFSVLLY